MDSTGRVSRWLGATPGTATCLESCEVNHAVDLGVLLKDFVKSGIVGHVDLVECGALPTDELDAVNGNLRRVVEIVNDDDIITILEQSERGKRPNVTGATASHNQYLSREEAFQDSG